MLKLKSNDIECNGTEIKVVTRTPQTDFPEHNHDFSELVLVSSGVGTHIINGSIQNLLPYTISCISDKDFHQYHGNTGVNLTNVIYKKEQLSFPNSVVDIIKQFEKHSKGIMLRESQFNLVHSISTQIQAEQNNNDPHSNHMSSLLFQKLWIILDRAQRDHLEFGHVMTPIVYICNHFRDPSLTINEICDTFSISQKQLTKAISELSGLSPVKFVNSLRIREAKLLLSQGKSITDVAMTVGFGDSNYFSTKFKSTVGCTPREFIKTVN